MYAMKYLPLKQISLFAGIMFLVSTFAGLPVALLLKSVPFGGWLIAFKSYLPVSGSLLFIAILMGWLFCELAYLNLKPSTTIIIFSLLSPLAILIFIGIFSQIAHGNLFAEITTQKGIENFILIYGLLSFLSGSLCYYAMGKKA